MAGPATSDHIMIVGASLAGAKAAETLRTEGFEGDIMLIGDEPLRPYERPPLSKWYLQGEAERDEAFVHDEAFYDEHRVETQLGTRVTALDAGARRLVLDGADDLAYDWLILATGGRPRMLPLPGADLPGVVTLRTLQDADRLRDLFAKGPRLVVIGAGFIGCEVAASARKLGLGVTVLEVADVPLELALGREVGARYAQLHRDHGVDLRTGVRVQAIRGDDAVERVALADGTEIDADVVVMGVGMAPNTELAEQAGLEVDNGVVCDERLRTSDEWIWACGDVASAYHPLYERHLRIEHWANALNQSQACAKSLLGESEPYDRVPYFYSDQYDVSMEYVGFGEGYDRVIFRGDLDGFEVTAFYLRQGRLLAAMPVGRHDDVEPAKALIAARATPEEPQLADPGIPLADLG